MAQQALSGCSSSAIDPDTVCVGCGQGEPEHSMLICDACLQGFHLGCFGMSEVPEGDQWACPGCSCLQRLAVGDLLVLESPQALYAGGEPHLTQGLYLASIAALGAFDKEAGGKQALVLSTAAPLPGSLRFYSRYTYLPLSRLPKVTQELAAELYVQTGTTPHQQVFLSSSRYGMLGSPAAAADAATEGWVAGPDSAEVAQRLLAGPARQAWLLQGEAEVSSRPGRKARQPATGPAAEQPGAQSSPPRATPQPAERVQRDSAGPSASAMPHPPGPAAEQPGAQLAPPCATSQPAEGMQRDSAGPSGSPAQQQQVPPAASQHPAQALSMLQQPFQGLPAGTALPPQQYPAQALSMLPQQQQAVFPDSSAQALAGQHLSALPFAGAFPQPMGGQQLLPAGPWQWPFMPHPALQQQLLSPLAAPPPSMFMPWHGMWPGLSGYWPPGLPLLPTPAAAAAGMAGPGMQPAAAAAGPGSGAGKRRRANSGQQVLLTEQAQQEDDDPATSDDDFLPDNPGPAAAAGSVAKVVYKVLASPRCRGSRMCVNPVLVKQQARKLCPVGIPLWRFLLSSGRLVDNRAAMTPAQLQAALASFSAQAPAHASFLAAQDNRNLPQHLATLLQLLGPADDPLTIGADVLTSRVMNLARLSEQRTTTLNNLLSACRCSFRLLFGRCLAPGIDAAPTTVTVAGHKLHIDLHSPLPDGSVTDFKQALQTRGGLAREPVGVIRSFETFQLHLLYSWRTLLHMLADLQARWREPRFVPTTSLAQVSRWCAVLLSQLFRGAVDFGRPADIALYHIGCFQLRFPDNNSIPLAAVVLHGLQQQRPQLGIDQLLEVFRAAGAVLVISALKCKQCSKKRGRNGGQCVDWVPLRKHILPHELAVLCPTRTLAFCMAAMWWAKGAVSARLLTVRKAGSCGKAAPKRHHQADFQATDTGCWKAPTSGDLNSCSPGLFLLQRRQQQGEQAAAAAAADDDSGSEGEEEQAPTAPSSSSGGGSGPWLSHTKPRKGAAVDVLAALRPLLGYDLRHSQQKCHLQCGVPLQQSGRLAAHTTDECKKYAASNSSYEADAAGAPIKLVSQEWSAKDALQAPLGPGGSIFGVPYDDQLFNGAAAVAVAAVKPQAAAGSPLAQALASMEGSLAQMQSFIASFSGLPDLDRRLHAPVLGAGSTDEQLPVRLLREFVGTLHLLSANLPEFLGRLLRVSAAGLAAPAAGRLVRPELAQVYSGLAAEVAQLSGQLGGGVAGQGWSCLS